MVKGKYYPRLYLIDISQSLAAREWFLPWFSAWWSDVLRGEILVDSLLLTRKNSLQVTLFEINGLSLLVLEYINGALLFGIDTCIVGNMLINTLSCGPILFIFYTSFSIRMFSRWGWGWKLNLHFQSMHLHFRVLCFKVFTYQMRQTSSS